MKFIKKLISIALLAIISSMAFAQSTTLNKGASSANIESPREGRLTEFQRRLPVIFAKAIKSAGLRDGVKVGDLVLDNNGLKAVITFDTDTMIQQGLSTPQMRINIGTLNSKMLVDALIQELIASGYNPRTEKLDIKVEARAKGLVSATGGSQTLFLGMTSYTYMGDVVRSYN